MRLGVDYVDIYQIHRPDLLMEPEEVARAFEELRRSGKVREFGVSNFRPSQVQMLQAFLSRPLAVHQIEVSLLQLAALESGVLDQCQTQGMTPLAWSPLGAGLLGDGGVDLLPGQRGYRPAGVLEVLERVAGERGSSRTAVALAWLLKHPAAIVPIVGSTRPERIQAAATAVNLQLSREEWYALVTGALGTPLA
jgi:predicted oxidoreductase